MYEPIVKKYRNEFATKKDLYPQWEDNGQKILQNHHTLWEKLKIKKKYTLVSHQVKNPNAYPYPQNLRFPTSLGCTAQTHFSLQSLINQQFCDPKFLRFIFFKNWYYIIPHKNSGSLKKEPLIAIHRRIEYPEPHRKQTNIWSFYTVRGEYPPTKFEKFLEVYTFKFVYLKNKRYEKP